MEFLAWAVLILCALPILLSDVFWTFVAIFGPIIGVVWAVDYLFF